ATRALTDTSRRTVVIVHTPSTKISRVVPASDRSAREWLHEGTHEERALACICKRARDVRTVTTFSEEFDRWGKCRILRTLYRGSHKLVGSWIVTQTRSVSEDTARNPRLRFGLVCVNKRADLRNPRLATESLSQPVARS